MSIINTAKEHLGWALATMAVIAFASGVTAYHFYVTSPDKILVSNTDLGTEREECKKRATTIVTLNDSIRVKNLRIDKFVLDSTDRANIKARLDKIYVTIQYKGSTRAEDAYNIRNRLRHYKVNVGIPEKIPNENEAAHSNIHFLEGSASGDAAKLIDSLVDDITELNFSPTTKMESNEVLIHIT